MPGIYVIILIIYVKNIINKELAPNKEKMVRNSYLFTHDIKINENFLTIGI